MPKYRVEVTEDDVPVVDVEYGSREEMLEGIVERIKEDVPSSDDVDVSKMTPAEKEAYQAKLMKDMEELLGGGK